MNRISRLLHKTFLKHRQRRAINLVHRYVIYDKDLEAPRRKNPFERTEPDDPEVLAQTILKGFDPENDQMDRRILFEVTGLTLNKDEFLGEDSSGSEGDLLADDVTDADPLWLDYNYR